jgi:RNA polymerase sigma-70 factor (ECF subfamily)
MNDDFAHIINGCRRRDPRAQRELYDRLAPMAMGVCMRYTHSRDDAQDLVQDTFVKVFENLHKLKKNESVGAWAYQICVNICIKHVGRKLKTMRLDDAGIEPVIFQLDPFTVDEVVEAMQKLPPMQRLAFNMVEIEGYPQEEAARKMKITHSSLRSNLSRAKQRLRELLEK